MNRRVLALLLFVCSILTLTTTADTSPREFGVDMITAHRGSSAYAPENTVSAILLAVEQKAGMVEIDVRMSADGRVVLSHDDSLSRTAGVPYFVSQSRYEDLRKLDVGAWFGRNFAGEPIPTLEDVLELTRGRVRLNIEIKMDGSPAELPEAVAGLVLRHEAADRVIITSFDMAALAAVKRVSEELQTGLIIGSMRQLTPDLYQNPLIDALSLRSSLVNRSVIERANMYNKKVYAWTVNRPDEMKKMARYGVDSIITDKPDLLFRVLF